MVAADELDRPAGVALQEEDHVADRVRLVVVPVGDERVDDEVALGPPRLPARVRGAQRVVAVVGAHARDVDRRRRGRRWRRRRRCGRRRAPACTRRSWRGRPRRRRRTSCRAHDSEPEVDDRLLERVHVDRTAAPGAAARREGRRGSRRPSARSSRCVPRPARTGACTRSPSRAGPSAAAAGSRSPARGSAATADRRTPTARAASASAARSPSGNRVSDQISISVSSGPSGRKRYDEALLYIGSTK